MTKTYCDKCSIEITNLTNRITDGKFHVRLDDIHVYDARTELKRWERQLCLNCLIALLIGGQGGGLRRLTVDYTPPAARAEVVPDHRIQNFEADTQKDLQGTVPKAGNLSEFERQRDEIKSVVFDYYYAYFAGLGDGGKSSDKSAVHITDHGDYVHVSAAGRAVA